MNQEELNAASLKYGYQNAISINSDKIAIDGFKAGAEWGYKKAMDNLKSSMMYAESLLRQPRPNYPSGTSEPPKPEDTDTILSHTENSI